jgi:hypothetical protein
MRQFCACFILLLTLTALRIQAHTNDSTVAPRWYVPHYVPFQFAGNIGLFALGLGYTSNHDNYNLSFLYGYVPSSVAATEIHTITAKNIFPITRYALKNSRILIPYLGIGLTIEVGGNAFFTMPPHYPEGYYDFPKNVHVIAYGGAKLRHLFDEDFKALRGIEFFAEAGTIDLYVWYKAISNQIKFNHIFSLALGVNLLLSSPQSGRERSLRR